MASSPSLRSVFVLHEGPVKKGPYLDTAEVAVGGTLWYIWTKDKDESDFPSFHAIESSSSKKGRRDFVFDIQNGRVVSSSIDRIDVGSGTIERGIPWIPDDRLINDLRVAYDEALEKGLVRDPGA